MAHLRATRAAGSRHRLPSFDRRPYERGLPGQHDPTGGFGGATPACSTLTLRAVLAAFGLLMCAVSAVLAAQTGLAWFAVILVVVAVVAVLDLAWVVYRERLENRAEPHRRRNHRRRKFEHADGACAYRGRA